jgi:GNAT superfamily N-acetyltransferase
MMMLGAIGLAKIKALAVAEPARGRNVGGSLLLRCRQVYFACGYIILYGQMPPTPGLDTFYRRNGFEVLDSGEGLDLWPVFEVHSRIDTDPGERFFIRYRPQP